MNTPNTSVDRPSLKRISSQDAFDRGRDSTFELVKLVVTLATASVAALFALLLKLPETLSLMGWRFYWTSLTIMTLVVAFGLAGWAADAAHYGAWGFYLHDETNDDDKERWLRRREVWRKVRRILWAFAVILFVGGVSVAGLLAWQAQIACGAVTTC
jgi:hypothetical protein